MKNLVKRLNQKKNALQNQKRLLAKKHLGTAKGKLNLKLRKNARKYPYINYQIKLIS